METLEDAFCEACGRHYCDACGGEIEPFERDDDLEPLLLEDYPRGFGLGLLEAVVMGAELVLLIGLVLFILAFVALGLVLIFL